MSGPGTGCHTQRGDRLLLLLIGGDKSSQPKDIAKAIRMAQAFGELNGRLPPREH